MVLNAVVLTDEWQLFEYELTGKSADSFNRVVGGFGWVIGWGPNDVRRNEAGTGPLSPKTFKFELRNIRFEE